jgi:beta-glucosidase
MSRALFLLGLALLLLLAWESQAQPEASFDRRAEELLSRMTLEEKVSQLNSDSPPIDRLHVKPFNWWQGG